MVHVLVVVGMLLSKVGWREGRRFTDVDDPLDLSGQ
jgi:hypothetical protein